MSKTATTHVKTRIQSGRSIRNYDRGITKHYDHHSSYPDTCDGLSFNVLQRYRKTTTESTNSDQMDLKPLKSVKSRTSPTKP